MPKYFDKALMCSRVRSRLPFNTSNRTVLLILVPRPTSACLARFFAHQRTKHCSINDVRHFYMHILILLNEVAQHVELIGLG
jgi:hypothetical protein